MTTARYIKKKHILSKGQDITISHNKPPGLDVISSSEINPVCKAEKRKEKKDRSEERRRERV